MVQIGYIVGTGKPSQRDVIHIGPGQPVFVAFVTSLVIIVIRCYVWSHNGGSFLSAEYGGFAGSTMLHLVKQ